MFIVVSATKDVMMHRTVSRYLYEGQSIVGLPQQSESLGVQTLIVDTGTDETYRSEYIRDRLHSGLFGAVLFGTLEEAEQYIRDNY